MLTAAQRRAREFKTTASQAPIIMSGNADKILRLWRERIGEIEPEDLSDVWPVQLGSLLEPFILNWHEHKTGMELTDRGKFYAHPSIASIGATLDAYRPVDDAVIDAKVCGSWMRLNDIVAYYTPQIIVQMRCRNAAHGALLICHGAGEPAELPVIPDTDYEKELWSRLAAFELCVQTLTPPLPLPAISPPPGEWREVDLDTLDPWPNWAHEVALLLNQWRDVRPQAMEFEKIVSNIKDVFPLDCGKLTYDKMTIRRNRRGALSVKED